MDYWDNKKSNLTWGYSKGNKNNGARFSAGILPYTFDQSGKCFFLLGKDTENFWSDFGGRSEFKDNNEPINTASREFYEETLGAVIGIQCTVNKLNGNPVKIVSKTLNGSPYYMYLIYIDYSPTFIESFNKILNFLKYYYANDKYHTNKIIEKTCIRWISMDTLINCIENKQNPPVSLRGVFFKTLELCKDQLQLLAR